VAGAILIAIAVVFVVPVAVIMSGVVAAAVLGEFFVGDAQARHEGSELIELNR
jgi:hypothetical protein